MKLQIIIFFLLLPQYAIADDYFNTEVIKDQRNVFILHTTGYYLTQKETIENEGSVEAYRDNFLKFNFDNDNVNWNVFGHTYTGSQVFLYYRARGYTLNKSLTLSFLSSLWFEIFIENYTEKPSIQDTFNTPMLGAGLGYFTEKISLKLIKSKSKYKRFFGRVLNPFTLLKNKKVTFIPGYSRKKGLIVTLRIPYD